ncbi:S-adenosyl-L-methionine-dependent methyltransferase, partial [Coemansia spiralis]
ESDAAVQQTSDDAAVSRESAARLGYIADPFIKHFIKHPQRRAPLINRGTYCRFHGIQRVLREFVAAALQPRVQCVVLGAGLDTSFFLLSPNLRYFEVDFADITAKKAQMVWRKGALRERLPEDTRVVGAELHSETYNLIAGDLREFPSVMARLQERGFDCEAPTLFVSECVLVYLDPVCSDAILDWITTNVPRAGVVTYEQIRPDDRFGQMMIGNLRARGLELRGLLAYPTLESTKNRFLTRGWRVARAVDLAEYHDHCVDKRELDRLAALELLDEWEEFRLLAQHYAFTF